ncbi:MAG TPA: transglutaminase-like domain-containing protein [Bryobacteraceae bacterium]
MNHLQQVLAGESARIRLDRAALDLASIHFPDLQPEPFLDQLNELASALGDRLRNFNDGRDFVEKASSYLFGELGFHGNESDFFDPRNSCLNQVLERRTGIPITLAVFYMEIARRLHMPVFGIGLPRHFVLEFNDGNFSTYIDPFGGRQLTAQECFALAGAQVADPILLQRATPKEIAMRMLQNLHGVYVRSHDFEKGIATLDLLLLGAPGIAPWYKRRGMMALELGRHHAARQDLVKYLELEPEAADRDAIRKQLQSIHLWLAQMS